jgi:hypothetical protein
MPAAVPWISRNSINATKEGAIEQSPEAMMNRLTDPMNSGRAP